MVSRDKAPPAKAWLMWGLTIVFLLFQFVLQGSVSGMAPFLANDFNTDVAAVGLVSSSYFWTYLLLQVPGGALADRIGARHLLIAGTVICAAGTLLFAVSPGIHTAMLARMLTGLGTAPALASCFYLIGNWFSPSYFAFVIGLSEALAMLSGGIGGEVISTLTTLIGWRHVLLYAGSFCLCLTVLMFFFLQDRPKYSHVKKPEASTLSIRQQLVSLLKLPQVWLNGLFSGLMFPIISVLATYWCIPYLMARYGIQIRVAAIGNLALFVGAGLGCPFLGHISDFFRTRKVVMAVGAAAAFITITMALYIPDLRFVTVIGLFFLTGLFASVYMLPFALVNQIAPNESRATAMGFTNMMSILFGAPLLTPIVGVLLKGRDWAGKSMSVAPVTFSMADYKVALSVIPICFLLALLVSVWIHEPKK